MSDTKQFIKELTEAAELIERVDNRCMGVDGPVESTAHEMSLAEVDKLCKLVWKASRKIEALTKEREGSERVLNQLVEGAKNLSEVRGYCLKLEAESAKILERHDRMAARKNRPFSIEKVMWKLNLEAWKDDMSQTVVVSMVDIRQILETEAAERFEKK